RVANAASLGQHVGEGPRCGMPIFELDRFTDIELPQLKALDLLFVPSRWAKEVLVANGIAAERVHVTPLGVNHEVFGYVDRVARAPTVFLNIGKWEVRKGHDVLAEAFDKAFGAKDAVRLVMMPDNPFYSDEEAQGWVDAYRSTLGARVQILDKRLP